MLLRQFQCLPLCLPGVVPRSANKVRVQLGSRPSLVPDLTSVPQRPPWTLLPLGLLEMCRWVLVLKQVVAGEVVLIGSG